jgi:hypothetical protein
MAGRTKTAPDERPAIIAGLAAWLSEGKTLREFCRQEGKPSWQSIYAWLDQDKDFSDRIARARLIGEDAIAQECLAIADTPQMGEETKTSDDGYEVKRGDMLGHRKLQIETRLKLLAKWNPKKWGDSITQTHRFDDVTQDQRDAALVAAGLRAPKKATGG